MKISWGTAIVLAIASFMAFILYLVISMTTNENLDHDLVGEEYYKQEIGFQEQMNRELNSQTLSENIQVERTPEGFLVHFPEDLEIENIEGTLFLYRPSDKDLDTEIPLALTVDTAHGCILIDATAVLAKALIRTYHAKHAAEH